MAEGGRVRWDILGVMFGGVVFVERDVLGWGWGRES